MADFEKFRQYSAPTLRVTLSLVFLWFGISQLIDPSAWTGYLPDFVYNATTPEYIIYANGTLEVIFAAMLILGFFVRASALILGLHLLGITVAMGYNAIGVRDFGLALATFVVFMNGADQLCLSNRFSKNKPESQN